MLLRRFAAATVVVVLAGVTVVVAASPAAAVSLTVTTATDVVADDGVCSLREAIEAADTDTASGASAGECPAGSGADLITFAVPGPFVLSGRELQIDSEVTVDGGGGGGATIDAGGLSAAIYVQPPGDAHLMHVTITGGDPGGVGVFGGGQLTVADSTVSDNPGIGVGGIGWTLTDTTVTGSGAVGLDGSGTVTGSLISNNAAGGIDSSFGSVSVSASTISDNGGPGVAGDSPIAVSSSTISGNVGGISDTGGLGWVTVSGSAISDNLGTGLELGYDTSVSIVESTISNNDGDGLAYQTAPSSSVLTVSSSTISGNAGWGISSTELGPFAQSTLDVEFSTLTGNGAGGISVDADSLGVVATVTASVVADNQGVGTDVHQGGLATVVSGGFNVVGDGDVGAFIAPGDVSGVVDPGLGPLGDNGGPTYTHGVLAGSPALDRVTSPVGSDPVVDQRGVVRPQGAAKDSGAFERDEVVLSPGGFGNGEGQSGSQVFEIPISLSRPSTETVTVDYVSWPCTAWGGCGDGLATEGVDYESPAPGTLTFLPGETTKTVPVTVYGDTDVEPRILWGEWFFIAFSNETNAVLDRSFFGLGAGIIGDDDP